MINHVFSVSMLGRSFHMHQHTVPVATANVADALNKRNVSFTHFWTCASLPLHCLLACDVFSSSQLIYPFLVSLLLQLSAVQGAVASSNALKQQREQKGAKAHHPA